MLDAGPDPMANGLGDEDGMGTALAAAAFPYDLPGMPSTAMPSRV